MLSVPRPQCVWCFLTFTVHKAHFLLEHVPAPPGRPPRLCSTLPTRVTSKTCITENTQCPYTGLCGVSLKCYGGFWMHEKKREIPQSTMNSARRWEMLLIIVWIEVSFVPGILCEDEAVRHLSRKGRN